MKASVIVVVHAGAHHLDDSVGSLAREGERGDFEVVVVDNGSANGCEAEVHSRYPWARVVRSERNLGFSGGVRLGAEAAQGDVLVLLNDDAAAAEGLVQAHLEVLADHPRAAVSGGRLVSWDGGKHDFNRGVVTFDCHAFQLGQGQPLAKCDPPARGEALPFGCGGNMAVRREDWEKSGGFDPELFAYFEDVELGWRLWAVGRETVAAPEAVARHRGSATSSGLGDFRRGVLFERNALRTFHACADEGCRAAFSAAIHTTFLNRMTAFAKERPELEAAIGDPFADNTMPPSRAQRWRKRIEERGLSGAARHLLARLLLGRRAGQPVMEDGFLLMQLRAAQGFVAGLPETQERNARLQQVRTVPDREILRRFPRLVVPTYRGDDEWFASEAFRSLLPADWPLEFKTLDEILKP